jgi:hypothetical protein
MTRTQSFFMSFALIRFFLSTTTPPAARHTQDLHKTPRRRHWHSNSTPITALIATLHPTN